MRGFSLSLLAWAIRTSLSRCRKQKNRHIWMHLTSKIVFVNSLFCHVYFARVAVCNWSMLLSAEEKNWTSEFIFALNCNDWDSENCLGYMHITVLTLVVFESFTSFFAAKQGQCIPFISCAVPVGGKEHRKWRTKGAAHSVWGASWRWLGRP